MFYNLASRTQLKRIYLINLFVGDCQFFYMFAIPEMTFATRQKNTRRPQHLHNDKLEKKMQLPS